MGNTAVNLKDSKETWRRVLITGTRVTDQPFMGDGDLPAGDLADAPGLSAVKWEMS